MKVFSITDIPEFSKKDRIVVVGIIGKSPYRYPNKTTPLLQQIQSDENGIECHWDERKGVLYLHAVTYLDTKRLAELAKNLDENSKSTKKEADAAHWLVASGELAADSCRVISLLFQLCHIVVLSSPTSTFDLGYLQFFKAIDGYRTELAAQITAALTEIGAEGSWEKHGRSSCPRLLFHFRRAPTPLRKNLAALKRLEHAVEDQLYFILRKTRIITNVCAKSLFAIPKNEEFVYMSTDTSNNARDVSTLIRGLVALCSGAEPEVATDRPSFKAFLQAHVDRAFNEGFDDNVGKFAMSTSFFELPSASSWRSAAQALAPVFLEEPPRSDDGEGGALHHALATDVRFSAARCAKVLPIAQASYTEGLPSHYSSQHHAHKVSVALGVLESMARGPLRGGAARRLRTACDNTWRSRTLCEALSLTGYGCIHPDHDSSKEHSSGVRYVSACECGRTRTQRDDPYTVRDANCSFYCRAQDQCHLCPTLLRHDFPVFQPSTPTYKAASVKGASSQEECSGGSGVEAARTPGEGGGWEGGEALSPGPADDDDDEPGYIVAVRDCVSDKIMSRQPSTTEYLPSMLHTSSPPGLLPAFPSWSLVCLGASSLYSHSLGLPEALQPGFLPHTNYLLPWDTSLPTDSKVEQASAWRAVLTPQPRVRGKPQHVLTVKIFIGFEYECPRGHRFMMSSPSSVVSGVASTGGGAGAAAAGGDMPLQAPCVCLGGAALSAQLTRVHVVTPKAPVHVTLDPKVQPVPGGSIFVPQPTGSPPVKLTASTYWVLRLPHVYSDERGTIPRPRTPPTHPGRIIAPLFGLQE